MSLLLDANIVIAFQSVGMLPELLVLAAGTPLHLSQIVLQELTDVNLGQSPSARASLSAAAALLPGPLRIERPAADSAVAQTYAELRSRRNQKNQRSQRNRGEDESLALALHNVDLHLVCHDGAAFLAAVNELGSSRVLTFHQFLQRLVKDGALAAETANTLAVAIANHKASELNRDQIWTLPHWWSDWISAARAAL